jgi:MFS family permease
MDGAGTTKSEIRTVVRGGWAVVLLGFLALALAFALRGSVALVIPVWQAEFGWSRAFGSGIAAVAMLVMAATAPFAGHAVDRYGPRWILAGGAILVGSGILLVTAASPGREAWLVPIGFSGIAALGFGLLAQHVVAAAVAARIRRHGGLATGLATAGSTGGQILLMPLLAILMREGDWRPGLQMLAIGTLISAPLTLLVIRHEASAASPPERWARSPPRSSPASSR